MENKEKGLFTGFGAVFSFTAQQSIKGKGFKLIAGIISLIVFAIAAIIPIAMANMQKPEESVENTESDSHYGLDDGEPNDYNMDTIVVLNKGQLPIDILQDFIEQYWFENIDIEISDLMVEEEYKEFAEYCVGNYKNPVGLSIDMDENHIVFDYYLFTQTNVSKDEVELFANAFEGYYNDRKYLDSGLSYEDITVLNMPAWSKVNDADDEENELGVVLAQMIIPAIFSFLLFMMTSLHGQSVTKNVMSEKCSKLMEVLLTSVKPYALIAGKIVAIAAIALSELSVWIVMAVAGFFAGDRIALGIYPEYHNYVFEIIDFMKESGTGFSGGTLVIAVLMTMLGFFMYCVWAGLIAAAVDNVDDVSSAMSLFQILPAAGFMIGYVGSLAEMDGLIKVAEYVPLVSPFVMPANVLIGKTGILQGWISMLLLLAFSVILILITGKIYKNKVFRRK